MRLATSEAACALGARWARSGLWEPERVAAAMAAARAGGGAVHGGTVQVKRSARAPTFMYSEGAHQRHLLKDDDGHDSLVDLTPAGMVEHMRAQDGRAGGAWYYYTASCDEAFGVAAGGGGGPGGGLGGWGDDGRRLDGWGDLIQDPMLARQTGVPQAPPSVWIGGAGTTTAAHYDVMDNAFVQLHGRKRFRIWGPEAVAALRVYPDLHPRARKTQLDLEATGAAAAGMALDVVLNPGDVLHVPAFTFHEVEALDMSVSVNVFSVCRSQLHGARILAFPVPVRNPDGAKPGLMLAHLATHVLPAFGVDSVADFFNDVLLDCRYRALLSPISDDGQSTSGERNGGGASSTIGLGNVDGDLLRMICDTIATAQAELLAPGGGEYGGKTTASDFPWNGYRDIIAAHLMESWALQLSGSPSLVHATLEEAAASL